MASAREEDWNPLLLSLDILSLLRITKSTGKSALVLQMQWNIKSCPPTYLVEDLHLFGIVMYNSFTKCIGYLVEFPPAPWRCRGTGLSVNRYCLTLVVLTQCHEAGNQQLGKDIVFSKYSDLSTEETAFENVACKMLVTSFRPQFVPGHRAAPQRASICARTSGCPLTCLNLCQDIGLPLIVPQLCQGIGLPLIVPQLCQDIGLPLNVPPGSYWHLTDDQNSFEGPLLVTLSPWPLGMSPVAFVAGVAALSLEEGLV